jgi:hypothetical protein
MIIWHYDEVIRILYQTREIFRQELSLGKNPKHPYSQRAGCCR